MIRFARVLFFLSPSLFVGCQSEKKSTFQLTIQPMFISDGDLGLTDLSQEPEIQALYGIFKFETSTIELKKAPKKYVRTFSKEGCLFREQTEQFQIIRNQELNEESEYWIQLKNPTYEIISGNNCEKWAEIWRKNTDLSVAASLQEPRPKFKIMQHI